MSILDLIKRRLEEAEVIQTLFSNQLQIKKALRQLNVRVESLERVLDEFTDSRKVK